MIEVFENIINMYSNESITTLTIISVLLMVLFLATYEFFVYRFVSHRQFYNKSFNITIAILPFFISTIILCLQSNIIITLGTIGALAIIRFRTAVKDPRDTAFIFWGVVSGLACGTQNYTIVLAGSIVICLVLFIFKKVVASDDKYLLIVKGESLDAKEVEKLIEKNVKYYTCKGKYIKNNDVELIYDVKLKKKNDDRVVDALNEIININTVNLVANNTDTMG